ncbi:MAG: cobalt-precorrin-5B (C(1))-methyltransferase [Parvibaculum sp.]|uniref:cobalt-precorrin-5B (C(1))-methyltransferase n=1 Tax=Parvibaculum sp. TaxID=2024848 RepID=UPI0025EA0F80|nr:cobalt-precorrin-5B (C(1))-methyltransferase [Parvibaculum sp.]MCE9649033.1 cobalt-precorrin-5B (C(1))-methyltransferase [Parvibaculum sp.]
MDEERQETPLRRGWTTGACATAATRAAYEALMSGAFPDPVEIRLPGGERPAFALARSEAGEGFASAAIVKDAGDDPDVTHGALVGARVSRGAPGTGIQFRAGPGVGMVTRPGLPIEVGEPAINPVPRKMIGEAVAEAAAALGTPTDVVVEISIADGVRLAERTLNGRLGIVGGLSVLGTTGIVIPFSCSAWIHSIHRGIDVARATGLAHVAGATGSTSEAAIAKLHGLPDVALIEMGDFVGGMLKYLRKHPVARVSVAGGPAKMSKLGQGLLDLHSKRGAVDLAELADLVRENGGGDELADAVAVANSAKHVFDLAAARHFALGDLIVARAWTTAAQALRGSGIELEVVLFDRAGGLVARTPFRPVP